MNHFYHSSIQFAYSHYDFEVVNRPGCPLPIPRGLMEQKPANQPERPRGACEPMVTRACACARSACDVSTGKGEVTAARGWSNERRRWNAVRCRAEQLKRQQRLVKHTRVSSQTVSHTHTHTHYLCLTHIQTHTFLCDRQFHSVVAEVLAYKKQCWYDLMGESYYKTVAGPV